MTDSKKISKIAQFVSGRVAELQGVRSQREISEMAGFTNQNMISMLKLGYTKVPLDRVVPLSEALDCDAKELMRMAMEQFFSPQTISDIALAYDYSDESLTKNERSLIALWRAETPTVDPAITPAVIEKLSPVFRAI